MSILFKGTLGDRGKLQRNWDLRDLLSGFESAGILQREMETDLQLESETIANVGNARFRMEESKWKWDETMAKLGSETISTGNVWMSVDVTSGAAKPASERNG
jgi:hypothetical protein